VVRVLWPFGTGIWAGYLWGGPDGIWSGLVCAILLLACMVFTIGGRRSWPGGAGLLFCTAAWGSLFFCGWGTGSSQRPSDPGLPVYRPLVIRATILSETRTQKGNVALLVQIHLVGTGDTVYQCDTRARYYLIDSAGGPAPGEEWLFCGTLVPITTDGNPGEVDYRKVMERQDCWYTFFEDDTALCRPAGGVAPEGASRQRLLKKISAQWTGNRDAVALLQAVCLGDRSRLTPELKDSYSRAGGMHLLAVSGLHVGMIWWVLNQLLKWLTLGRRREIFRFLPLAFLLWGYAWLTGFSTSVLRSVTMFTLFSLARVFERRSISFNTVFLSMLILLCAEPVRLFQAGFQLSYSAVLGILCFHPLIRSVCTPAPPLVRWIRDGVSVSLAAQAGTLPLVVYYFHQFPVYGVLTTLLSIPLLTLIMVVFVAGSPLLLAGIGGRFAGWPMVVAARLMNRIAEHVKDFPGAVFSGFGGDPVLCLLLFLAIACVALYVHTRKTGAMALVLLMAAMMLLTSAKMCLETNKARELWVMHIRGASLVTVREGLVMDHYLWASGPEQVMRADRYLESAWGHRSMEHSVIIPGPNLECMALGGGVSVCLKISDGLYYLGNDDVSCLVLSGEADARAIPRSWNSPEGPDVIVLHREPALDQAELVALGELAGFRVADGSNRSWYVDGLPGPLQGIHLTRDRGAFRLAY